MKFSTSQEEFWAGDFGNEYVDRNQGKHFIASNLALFSKIFSKAKKIDSVMEFGANIGQNLMAIRQLLPQSDLGAVEINQKAAVQLAQNTDATIYNQSLLDFDSPREFDFVFSKGVLIHLDPAVLPNVYDKMFYTSKKYICIVEYFNPTPVSIEYRGENDKLFKRDFAGEMLDRFPNLELVDYGFTYRRDPNFRLDNSTWFLLEKR
jgi:pseudaminic acid biosynthesis-associated methylase